MPQNTIHQRFLPLERDRWYQKTALLELKIDENCLFTMHFFVFGSRLSGTTRTILEAYFSHPLGKREENGKRTGGEREKNGKRKVDTLIC